MLIDLAQTALVIAIFGALASPGIAFALVSSSSAKRFLAGLIALASMLVIGPVVAIIIRAGSWRLFVGKSYDDITFTVDDWLEMVGLSLVGNAGIVAIVLSLRIGGWFVARRSSGCPETSRTEL